MNRFQEKILQDALDDPSKLTDWEYDFVNSLVDRNEDRDGNYQPSEKENTIINRISQKYA
jgi:hypothetical protein